jgi:hypothetical protein
VIEEEIPQWNVLRRRGVGLASSVGGMKNQVFQTTFAGKGETAGQA